MLLAQELALVASGRETGRHAVGRRPNLNACLGGLFLADLILAGCAAVRCAAATITLTATPPDGALLAAVADVVLAKGPKIRSVLSGMDRGLAKQIGQGTWDAAVALDTATEAAGDIAAAGVTALRRQEVIARLQSAAASDSLMDPRTALLLSMTGPAYLLEVVAPQRGKSRKHARERIDHAVDGSPLECLPRIVRKLIADNNAAASAAYSG